MSKYKIEHDRPNCIGCEACVGVAPDFWEMKDDKSHLKNAKTDEKGWEELDLKDEEEYQLNRRAADTCPVNVIHIVDKETKKRIV